MEYFGKRILVLGASGALGSELVNQLTELGANVIGTARTIQSAENIPSGCSLKLVVDFENPASIAKAVADLSATGEVLDGIVNAVGVVGFAKATETSLADSTKLMQLNHLGPASLISQLHGLLSGANGAFVASITGIVAERTFPGMSSYCASKTAHSAFLATLAQEWRRDRITITDARPGHTETGLAGRAIFGTAPTFPQGMTASHVVQRILDGIRAEKSVIPSSDF